MLFVKILLLTFFAFNCILMQTFNEECDKDEEVIPGTPLEFQSDGYSNTNVSKKYTSGMNCRRHYTTQRGYTLFVNGSISLDRTPGVLSCAGQHQKFLISREGLKSLAHGEIMCAAAIVKVMSIFNRITIGYTSDVDDNRAGRFSVSVNAVVVPKTQCECGWGLHSFRNPPSRQAFLGFASTVGIYNEEEDAIVCTGVIISYDYVLSGSHCFPDPEAAKTLKILAGYRVYPAEEDDYQATYEIESVVAHENFQATPSTYDIAIIKTTTPIEYTLGVSPICLPMGRVFQSEDFYGRSKTFDLVAWPKYNGDGAEQNLLNELKRNMQIVTCTKFFPELYGSKNHVCTEVNPLSNVTAEHNGAMLSYTSGDRRYLVGIYNPSFQKISGYPTVYLRVTNFLPWIISQTNQTSFCSKLF